VLGKEGETRTVYDYSLDVEVRSYFATDGASAVLVDSQGKTLGALGSNNGEITGRELLKGDSVFTVVKP
jgi:alpha-D-xyloside xylohydrolase